MNVVFEPVTFEFSASEIEEVAKWLLMFASSGREISGAFAKLAVLQGFSVNADEKALYHDGVKIGQYTDGKFGLNEIT